MINKYHLYIEFWVKNNNGEKVLKIIERDFSSFADLSFTHKTIALAIKEKKLCLLDV